jgi:hypothetical protein
MKVIRFYPKKALVPGPVKGGTRKREAVFTQNLSVIAVDALSPVMEKYSQEKREKNFLEIELILAGCAGMKP